MHPFHQPTLCTCLAMMTLVLAGPSSRAEEFDLYYLGGQSNMEGFGRVAELPAELKGPVEGAVIYHSPAVPDQSPARGAGKWARFQPGHGTGFRFENGMNRYSDRFGIEVSFVNELRRANPERGIALIKYARNGSAISVSAAGKWGCWDPDFHADSGDHPEVNQYDHFLATLRNATGVGDIDGDGKVDQLIPRGIVWMQGESDATASEEVAAAYEANLRRLIDLMRAALRQDDLPVVIGRISDSGRLEGQRSSKTNKDVWKHGDRVRASQRAFVESDRAASMVTSTDGYRYSDPWHYDSAGYVDLGKQFALGLLSLQNE